MTASQIVFLAAFAPIFGGSLFWLGGHVAFAMEV